MFVPILSLCHCACLQGVQRLWAKPRSCRCTALCYLRVPVVRVLGWEITSSSSLPSFFPPLLSCCYFLVFTLIPRILPTALDVFHLTFFLPYSHHLPWLFIYVRLLVSFSSQYLFIAQPCRIFLLHLFLSWYQLPFMLCIYTAPSSPVKRGSNMQS